MYMWASHTISMANSCGVCGGGGCKKLVRCGRLSCVNLSLNHYLEDCGIITMVVKKTGLPQYEFELWVCL